MLSEKLALIEKDARFDYLRSFLPKEEVARVVDIAETLVALDHQISEKYEHEGIPYKSLILAHVMYLGVIVNNSARHACRGEMLDTLHDALREWRMSDDTVNRQNRTPPHSFAGISHV